MEWINETKQNKNRTHMHSAQRAHAHIHFAKASEKTVLHFNWNGARAANEWINKSQMRFRREF